MAPADTCSISLTYRGDLIQRGVGIERDTYGKTWTLRLADGLWTLVDHNGQSLHTFTRHELHRKVMFPGTSRGYDDLYLVGLGPQVYCFQPEPEVLEALRAHVEASERADAPRLAKWHRRFGLGFLILGGVCLAVCTAALSWAIRDEEASASWRLSVTLAVILPGLVVGGFFAVVGVRDLIKAKRFARMSAENAAVGQG